MRRRSIFGPLLELTRGDCGWAVLEDHVFMHQTPGGWVWCSGGRQDKRLTRTGTRGRLDNIVMGSSVIAQEA